MSEHPADNVAKAARTVASGHLSEIATTADDPAVRIKRELFAIEAWLGDVLTREYDRLRYEADPDFGLATSATGYYSYNPDASYVSLTAQMIDRVQSLETVHDQFISAGNNTALRFDKELIEFLERPEYRTAVARAGKLIDLLPVRNGRFGIQRNVVRHSDSRFQTSRFTVPVKEWVETDASLVFHQIQPGLVFQAEFGDVTLQKICETVLREDPLTTWAEMVQIARRSEALTMQAARLNQTQLGFFRSALQVDPKNEGRPDHGDRMFLRLTPHTDNYVYDREGGKVRYRKPPEDFLLHHFPSVTDPETGESKTEERITRVGDLQLDARQLESTDGCPARIPVAAHASPALRRAWDETINRMIPTWKRMLPTVRLVSNVSELPGNTAAILAGLPNHYTSIEIEGLGPIHVSILQPKIGISTLEADSFDTLDALEVVRDETSHLLLRLKPGVTLDPNTSGEKRFLTFSPTGFFSLQIADTTDVTVEGALMVDAIVPADGTLVCSSSSAHIVADHGSRVVANIGHRVDIEALLDVDAENDLAPASVRVFTTADRRAVRVGGDAARWVTVEKSNRDQVWVSSEMLPASVYVDAQRHAKKSPDWHDLATELPFEATEAQIHHWLEVLKVPSDSHSSHKAQWFNDPDSFTSARHIYLRSAGELPTLTGEDTSMSRSPSATMPLSNEWYPGF